MKALMLEKADGPESVAVKEVATPTPKAGEVRVAVKAASLNHRELWIPRGQYPGMRLPTILGCDCAGVVDEVGSGVSGAKPGDEVVLYPGLNWGPDRRAPARDFGLLGMPGPGTIAQYVCVPVENLAPKPAFMSFEEAAAVPLTGVTAWRALFFKGELKAGETVLIIGVGGGVATFALAFAVAKGADAYVTGETDEILETAKAMGAKGGLKYTDPDWRKQVQPLTGGVGHLVGHRGGDQRAADRGALLPGLDRHLGDQLAHVQVELGRAFARVGSEDRAVQRVGLRVEPY